MKINHYILLVAMILLPFVSYAQHPNTHQPTLSGRIVDAGGEPLVGAQVRWKDTKTVAVTDVDGNFHIPQIQGRHSIVVSYIGYKSKTIPVKNTQQAINIIMDDDAQNLDELVVVGYGIQKKSALTGSVETIKQDELLMMPTVNIDKALTGQVAGLQVMQATGDPTSAKESNMSIRGINAAPLLVIDGVPRFGTNTSDGETRLSDLNPDDIESISILKDAAAAAVYGARAANGVILVKTKGANGDRKNRVNYRGQYNMVMATQMPQFLDAYQFALLRNRAVENSPTTTIKPFTNEQLEQIRNHSNPNVYGNEDYMSYLNNTGWSTSHSVSANGGGKTMSYYLSFGYADSKGLYSGVGRKRLNYMAKIDVNVARGLALSVSFDGSKTRAKNSSYFTIDNAYAFSPLQVARFDNGMLASIDGTNPLISVQGLGGYIKDNGSMSSIAVNLNYTAAWLKGLTAYVRGVFDDNKRVKSTVDNPVTLYTYDADKGSYDIDSKTVYPTAKATQGQDDFFFDSQLYEAGVNFNRTFTEKHDVEGMLVANYQRTHTHYMNGINLDKSVYPEIIGTAQKARLNGNEIYNQRASLIGRAKYGFANKYFCEFSFRLDGSNNFHPDRRWGFFPSMSAAWVISNEKFFRNWKQGILSNAKLRASTGWLGNDGLVGAYSYLRTYTETVNSGYNLGGNFTPGLMMSSNPNIFLTWGKSHDYNVAADLGFWGGRFGLSFEYYLRYETDKITAVPDYLYPPSTGVDGMVPNKNFSKLKAWGWDLTLNHRNTIGKLKYSLAITLAKNNDKFIDFGDESTQLPNLRRKGRSSMVWTMYQADGLFKSQEEIESYGVDQDGMGNATLAPGDIKYVDQNGDHKIDANDRVYVRNSSRPDLDMGLRINLQYKGFFINAMFQGEWGYKQNISELYTLDNGTLQKFQKYHLTDTWTPDTPNARYPRIKFATKNDNNRRQSTFWISDCNFMRLKLLSLGYQLPSTLVRKLKISSASVALQGSNIFTITNLKNMDPESLRGYPVQKTYGITLSLGF